MTLFYTEVKHTTHNQRYWMRMVSYCGNHPLHISLCSFILEGWWEYDERDSETPEDLRTQRWWCVPVHPDDLPYIGAIKMQIQIFHSVFSALSFQLQLKLFPNTYVSMKHCPQLLSVRALASSFPQRPVQPLTTIRGLCVLWSLPCSHC